LPTGSTNSPASYWAFSLNAPFGNCRLEYVTDLEKLRTDYDFRAAKHPMVGNPCSRTVYDPLKMMNIPGSIWARGAIVQGSDVRPPLGIEVEIHDRQILAARMEHFVGRWDCHFWRYFVFLCGLTQERHELKTSERFN